MRRVLAAVVVVLTCPAPSAHAETSPDLPFALAVDTPVSWANNSFAASAYYAVSDHQVVRLNVAYYAESPPLLEQYFIAEAGGDFPDTTGGTSDLSIGWSYFPRRAYDGMFVEAAALGRLRHWYNNNGDDGPGDQTDHTAEIGARALVGWSWRLFGRGFVSMAAGGSLGYEWGYQILQPPCDGAPSATTRISRADPEFEYFVRIGTRFGL
jgi:hypothetical protein